MVLRAFEGNTQQMSVDALQGYMDNWINLLTVNNLDKRVSR
jgi:hypothetical protein